MKVSVDSSGPLVTPSHHEPHPHHHPIPTSGPIPTSTPLPPQTSRRHTNARTPSIRKSGRSGRESAVVSGLLLLLLRPPPDGVRLDVLEGAAAGLGHTEGDEQDAEDADDAEDREHRVLAHGRRHDREQQTDEERSDPVERAGQSRSTSA